MIDFLGIGAQKAGTTWLFMNLSKHKDIEFPSGKELHFWNKIHNKSDADLANYLSLFSDETSSKKGEITPAYAIIEKEIIEQIHQVNDRLRIIMILRNPIERAWSSALMALKRAEMQFDEASNQWFIDHFNSSGSLKRGDYSTCLKNWLSVFGQEQVLVEWYENIQNDPVAMLKRCCSHLGVSPTDYDSVSIDEVRRRVFEGPPDNLRKELLSELRKLYYPCIQQLETEMKVNLSHWYI